MSRGSLVSGHSVFCTHSYLVQITIHEPCSCCKLQLLFTTIAAYNGARVVCMPVTATVYGMSTYVISLPLATSHENAGYEHDAFYDI